MFSAGPQRVRCCAKEFEANLRKLSIGPDLHLRNCRGVAEFSDCSHVGCRDCDYSLGHFMLLRLSTQHRFCAARFLPKLPDPLDPQSRLRYRSGVDSNKWRRGQVAKAADCKSAIAGSNPADASDLAHPLPVGYFFAPDFMAFSFCLALSELLGELA